MLDWWKDWPGETCVCVASGPSAEGVPLENAKGKARFIAVNNSYRLAPWADIFYACDGRWWRKFNDALAEYPALKLTSDERVSHELGLPYVKVAKPSDIAMMDEKGVIGWGGNSGFHTINLAMQVGCSRIVLVGYDMTLAGGNHWHADHQGSLTNPTPGNVSRWCRAVDGIHGTAKRHEIEILNCSAKSALRNYPKVKFDEVFP